LAEVRIEVPPQTVTFRLLVDGQARLVDVPVGQLPPPPPVPSIDTFTALPAEVPAGGSVSVTWRVTGADEVTLVRSVAGEDVELIVVQTEGTRSFAVFEATAFRLIASNASGETERSASVLIKPPPTAGTASFVTDDWTSRGGWKGRYGQDGLWMPTKSPALPDYATAAFADQREWLWGESNEPWKEGQRELERPYGGTLAAAWYATVSFKLDLTISGGPKRVAMYFLAHDGPARERTVRVEAKDAASGVLLDSRTFGTFSGNEFSQGVWQVWDVAGAVTFTFTNAGGGSASLSGLLFGPAGEPPPPPEEVEVIVEPFPEGTVGQPYGPVVLPPPPGPGPHQWSAQGLPPGLLMNEGAVVGTPTVAGEYPIDIVADDAAQPEGE
jgi:hypothetical protein